MRILVMGGAGYIGTHLVVELLLAGHDVVVVDDFSSGHREALRRAEELGGAETALFEGDIADRALMAEALRGIDVVIHLAAYKQVGESMMRPEKYFANNLAGTSALIESMQAAGVTRIVYSSSAAVYGTQDDQPISEDAPLRPDSPYGLTKAQGEQLLHFMSQCRGWSAVSLRYFNPVGAHASGRIGEPLEYAASLVPRALMAIDDPRRALTVFGTDYKTPDGTALRDYIHVCDLAMAHLAAMATMRPGTHNVFNVGTGIATSVREVLDACERATGHVVPHVDGARRPGDIPVTCADTTRFEQAVAFRARRTLDEMVSSAWRWHLQNPGGYEAAERRAMVVPLRARGVAH
jgi:UDP-glucose 4-epimerase